RTASPGRRPPPTRSPICPECVGRTGARSGKDRGHIGQATDVGTIREADPALTDPERFGAVFDRYFGEIHGYAARRVGRDAAADIAAEVFLTAFRLRRRFDPGLG